MRYYHVCFFKSVCECANNPEMVGNDSRCWNCRSCMEYKVWGKTLLHEADFITFTISLFVCFYQELGVD